MRKRRPDERGASLVEVGLVMPLLILLAIGLSEIGFLVIDYITVSNAARAGARTAAAAADNPNADEVILDVVEEAVCNLRFSNVESVTIFKAPADGSVPTLPSNDANVWVNTGPLSSLDCDVAGTQGFSMGTNCCNWLSTSRDRIPPDFDTIGIQVEFSHTSVTGLFPFPTVNWTEIAVMQIEPDTTGTQ
jgi:TadE-like protein